MYTYYITHEDYFFIVAKRRAVVLGQNETIYSNKPPKYHRLFHIIIKAY